MNTRIIIYDRDGAHLVEVDTLSKNDVAERAVSNDLRPMRPLFRKALLKRADEEGVKVRVPFKNPPRIIVTPEKRHATIRASYSTSH